MGLYDSLFGKNADPITPEARKSLMYVLTALAADKKVDPGEVLVVRALLEARGVRPEDVPEVIERGAAGNLEFHVPKDDNERASLAREVIMVMLADGAITDEELEVLGGMCRMLAINPGVLALEIHAALEALHACIPQLQPKLKAMAPKLAEWLLQHVRGPEGTAPASKKSRKPKKKA